MPLPPPTFTKTKWLAFFADLVAKVTHHNVLIVLEACEVIKRLLVTRVSVAAFLEQGDLLVHILDTIGAVARCEKLPTELDVEMQFSLLQVLQLVVNMAMSLYADGDEYYTLLVVARSGTIVAALTEALKGKNQQFFGAIASIVKTLLSLPLTKPRRALPIEEGIAAVNHVRSLEEHAKRNLAIIKELGNTVSLLAVSSATGAVQICAQYIGLVVCEVIAKATAAGGGGGELPSGAAGNQSGDASVLAPDGAQHLVSPDAIRGAYELFHNARSHADCFAAVNCLQCYHVVAPELCGLTTTDDELKHCARFLGTKPSSSLDTVLFRMLCSWFVLLITRQGGITPQLRSALLDVVRASLLPMLVDVVQVAALPPPPGELLRDGVSKSSLAGAILTFLTAVEPTANDEHIIDWIRAGLFASLEAVVSGATGLTSMLIDAPSTIDGSLSDEAYLQCALKSCRSEAATLAVTAMKFLGGVFVTRGQVMEDVFPEETFALAKTIIPHCMKIAVNNPTLSVAEPGTIASVVHHVPRCPRASRATSIGECSVVLIDAILAHCGVNATDVVDPVALLRWIPSLARATRGSVHPHLRSAAQRILLRMSSTTSHLVMIVKELPSCIPTASATVLKYSSAECPPWEAAAAAELIAHILSIAASGERAVERSFSVCETAMPLQLLKLVAGNLSSGYPVTALLSLLCEVWEQQKRLGPQLNIAMYPAVAPNGRKSMPMWQQILESSTTTLRHLNAALARLRPIRSITGDGLARALSTFEDIAVQCTFAASAARGLTLTLREFPDYRDELRPDLVIDFVAACFAVPTPAELALVIGQRFSVAVSHPQMLQRAFEEMLSWVSELGVTWHDAKVAAAAPFQPLERTFLLNICGLLSSDLISQFSRARIAIFVNSVIQLRHNAELQSSIDSVADQLFTSSLHLHDAPHIHGLRARLVSQFPAAAAAAYESGWVRVQIRAIAGLVATLAVNKQLTVLEHERLAVQLSLVASVVSCNFEDASSHSVDKVDAGVLVECLLSLLAEAATRTAALRMCRAVSSSVEGRRLLLVEVAAADFHGRSLFARLLSMAFGGRLSSSDSALCLDAVSAAIGLGGESFALAVVKLKFVEAVEGIVCTLDRQRANIPLGILRFLASATTSSHVQPVVARRAPLLTILVDLAQAETDRGVLALMVLRNLCFHHGCKTQICQDARIMQAFRAALVAASESSTEHGLRRQELAMNALWALVHNNQRGRSYVRGLLRQGPAVSLPTLAKSLPCFSLGSAALKQYESLMRADIEALEECAAAA